MLAIVGRSCRVTRFHRSRLAKTVLSLANNRQEAKEMGLSARAYVEKHFDRTQQSQEFVKLLESLV
jgi:hypothetical protein